MLIDTHAHLDLEEFAADFPEVLERAKENGVGWIVNIGYDLESSRRAVALARQFPQFYAAIGVHPHEAEGADEATWPVLTDLASEPKAVAVGEIGLDYYRDLSPRPRQQAVFRRQIALARELGRPVIIHDRDAHQDTLTILKEERAGELGGVMHCFSGSWETAKECLKLGFYISIAGPVTFRNAPKVQEVAQKAPLDRLLVETDSPYLAPDPYRGKRNESAYVRLVAEKIASLRGIGFEQVAEATTANARRLFGI